MDCPGFAQSLDPHSVFRSCLLVLDSISQRRSHVLEMCRLLCNRIYIPQVNVNHSRVQRDTPPTWIRIRDRSIPPVLPEVEPQWQVIPEAENKSRRGIKDHVCRKPEQCGINGNLLSTAESSIRLKHVCWRGDNTCVLRPCTMRVLLLAFPSLRLEHKDENDTQVIPQ